MKTIILIATFFLFVIKINAQITLEHDYDSSATWNFCSGNQNELMIVNFEVSGYRYVKINRCGKVIDIYNMNHSLVKTISLAGVPQNNGVVGYILYLSQSLFDTDSAIEFMYSIALPGGTWVTNIYKEDGTVIFSDSCVALVYSTIPMQQYPIYNTPVGTKMILSYINSISPGHAKVFGLPGTLTTGIEQGNAALMQAQGGSISNLYPNPSNGAVTLQYNLPKDEREGQLVLYNMQGQEVKRYKVDNTFNDLLLDNTMLPAGTYFYQLQTSKGAVGTKKMIVIK